MQITTLKQEELELLFFYIALEGWDIEEAHIRTLFKVHPNDFFIAYKNGNLLGFILAIKYSFKFGFISTFLIVKEFRGLGYSKTLFTHALKHLDGCQIALDSIASQTSFYRKFGFQSYFDVISYRYILEKKKIISPKYKISTSKMQTSLHKEDNYLQQLLQRDDLRYKEIKSATQVKSFAFSFAYKDGYKITIESNDRDETFTLFFALSHDYVSGTPLYIQVTPLTPHLVALAKSFKMSETSKFIRMYNKIL